MGTFTFVLPWVLQDLIVLVLTLAVLIFITKKEEHPVSFYIEMFCFVFLNAAIYENLASYQGMYGYGKSILMFFNVPITIPLVEYIVIYAALRMSNTMKLPTWIKPIFVGVIGIVYDFSLDPLSVKQIYTGVHEAAIGRWSWFPEATDPQIFGIPVFNFSGWFILCSYSAVFLLIGRYLYRRSGYKTWVSYIYPPVAMILALLTMISPISDLLLWLGPFMNRGSISQWIMLITYIVLQFLIFACIWKGRMESRFSFRDNWPAYYILIGTHIVNIIFSLVGGHYSVIPLQVISLFSGALIIVPVIISSKKMRR